VRARRLKCIPPGFAVNKKYNRSVDVKIKKRSTRNRAIVLLKVEQQNGELTKGDKLNGE
jgi:hypothetical protein